MSDGTARAGWVCAAVLALGGCRAPQREVTVFAASSLRESLTQIAGQFEARHLGTRVQLQFAGSQELRTQVQHGARADIIATADEAQMAVLVAEGLAREPRTLTCNVPVLIVSKDAVQVKAFADLALAQRVVLGAPEVPIGRYADAVLARAGAGFATAVQAHVVSREPNVRQVLAKVTLGEADAAIVYRTDARVAGDAVRVLEIPASYNSIARYRVARGDGANAVDGSVFLTQLFDENGQNIFSQHGFLPCP